MYIIYACINIHIYKLVQCCRIQLCRDVLKWMRESEKDNEKQKWIKEINKIKIFS